MATPLRQGVASTSIKVGSPPHRASCLEGDDLAFLRSSIGRPSIDVMPFDYNFFLTNHARKERMMAKLASTTVGTSTNCLSQYERRNTCEGKSPPDTNNGAHRVHVHDEKNGAVVFSSVASSPSSPLPRVQTKVKANLVFTRKEGPTDDVGLPVLRAPVNHSPPNFHVHSFLSNDVFVQVQTCLTLRKSSSSPCRAYPSPPPPPLDPTLMSVLPSSSPRRLHYEELYRQDGSCQEVINSHDKQRQRYVRPELEQTNTEEPSKILGANTIPPIPLKFTPRAPRVSAASSSSSNHGGSSNAVAANKEGRISSSLSSPSTHLYTMGHNDDKKGSAALALTHQWSTRLLETERERRAAISLAESTQRVSLHRLIKFALDSHVWPLRMRLLVFREEPKARADNVTIKEMHERRLLQGGFAAGLVACAQAETVAIGEREMLYGRTRGASLDKVYDVSSFFSTSPSAYSSASTRDHVDVRATVEKDALGGDETSGDWRKVHPQLCNTLISIAVRNCVNDEASRRKFLEIRDEASGREMLYARFTEELSTTVEAKRAARRHLERIGTYQGSNRSFYEVIAMRIMTEDVFMEEIIEREALYRRFLFSTGTSSSLSFFDDCNEKTDANLFDDPETISARAAIKEPDDTHEVQSKGGGEDKTAGSTTMLALPEAEARSRIAYQMMAKRRCIECHALFQREATGRESEFTVTQSAPRTPCSVRKKSVATGTYTSNSTMAADGLNSSLDNDGVANELCVSSSRLSILEEERNERDALILGTLLPAQEYIHRIGLTRECHEYISVALSKARADLKEALVADLARHHACLAIQRWARAIRMGFRGWRATHRRVGGWCALYRQTKRVDQRRSRDLLLGWGGY